MPLFGRRPRRGMTASAARVTLAPASNGRDRSVAQTHRDSLTASGERVTPWAAASINRLRMPWQARAFSYFDMVPEAKYAGLYVGHAMSKLQLYAAELNDEGEPEPTDDPDALATLARMQDPGGGTTMLLNQMGILMFLVGEGFLFVSERPKDEGGGEQWEFLSTDEIRPTPSGNGYQRYEAPMLTPKEYRDAGDDDWSDVGSGAMVFRIWTPHPRWSAMADSSMRGVLDICEELVLLTQAVRSRARSRMAGPGILLVDDRIAPPPPQPVQDEDMINDPWYEELIESTTASIKDEGSASAFVPMLVRASMPAETNLKVADLIHHLQVIDPNQYYPEEGLRNELIRRFAIGVDLPPERITGLGNTSHWNAWEIDDDDWKNHLEPLARRIVGDLSSSWYRQQLRKLGVTNWQKHLIAFDATKVVTAPDRSQLAQKALDDGAIGYEAYRRETGFDESDAQTDEEHQEWLGIKLRDPSYAVTGVVSLPRAAELEPVNQAGEPEIQVPPAPGGGTGTPPTNESKPQGGDQGPPEQPTPNGGVNAAAVHGAAQAAVYRAREAAGSRVASLAKRDPEIAARINGTPRSEIVALIGKEGMVAIQAPQEKELIRGARSLIEETLRSWSLDQETVTQIANAVEQHVLMTLYERKPKPLPSSFYGFIEGLIKSAR